MERWKTCKGTKNGNRTRQECVLYQARERHERASVPKNCVRRAGSPHLVNKCSAIPGIWESVHVLKPLVYQRTSGFFFLFRGLNGLD